MCTGNSARSVIAEYLRDQLGREHFHARSAGTGARGVHELAVRALDEAGIDASGARSRQVDALVGERFDYVITVCNRAAETCPALPGAVRRLHWSFADAVAVDGSEEVRLEAFRVTARAIGRRIEEMIHDSA